MAVFGILEASARRVKPLPPVRTPGASPFTRHRPARAIEAHPWRTPQNPFPGTNLPFRIHTPPALRLVLLVALAACGVGGGTGPAEESADMAPAAPASVASGGTGREAALKIRPEPSAAGVQASIAPAMVIRTGTATVEVDSVEAAVARAQRLAVQLGGYVGNTSLSTGDEQRRSATVELKIPAARFDQAVGGLRPIGRVESVETHAQDVGEEYVDLAARTANARRLEERLLALLANRTGRLEDVLAVERELARVRQEIDSQDGRLRYLRSRVAVSTLTVTLHEPAPVIGAYPGSSPIADAFRDMWRNFVGFTAGFIASLGFLVPLGLILAVLFKLFRRFRRRKGG